MVKDVVCGMMVDERNPAARATYKGREFLFCHANCKKAFLDDPEKYLRRDRKEGSKSREG